jgi:hypothetical protein
LLFLIYLSATHIPSQSPNIIFLQLNLLFLQLTPFWLRQVFKAGIIAVSIFLFKKFHHIFKTSIMKILQMLPAIVYSMLILQVNAQNELPKGFVKGGLVLADSTVVNGYIKDDIRKDASLAFLNEAGGKRIKYTGDDLISAEIDGSRFTCIGGDFFKIVCKGELCFLQKSSDVSGRPSFNGTEALFVNGTPGKAGEYFIYDSRVKELKLLSKKTFAGVTAVSFAGCAAAIEKARAVQGNIALLSEAVAIYNNNLAATVQ